MIRRITTSHNALKGTVAGCPDNRGYLIISIYKKPHQVHRLIWFWHHGYFPEKGLDHSDQDKSNNRIENLREISQVCNLLNTSNRSNNTSGVKGISWCACRERWEAKIATDGKTHHIGRHGDFTEAVAHRLAAEQCLNWENCDSSSPAFRYMQEVSK